MNKSSFSFPLLYIGLTGAVVALWFFPTFSIIQIKQISASELGQVFLGFIFISLIIERATQVYSNINLEAQKREIRQPVTKAEIRVDLARRAVMADVTQISSDADAVKARQKALEQAIDNCQEIALKTTPALSEHENKARKQTTILAMSLGVLAAIVGVRALGSFLEPDQLANCIAGGVDPDLQKKVMDAVASIKGLSEEQLIIAKAVAEEAYLTPCLFEEWQRRLLSGIDVLITGALLGGGADALHQIVKRLLAFVDQAPYDPTA